MTEEAYVSFETAKFLKEKGFREICNHYYNAQYNQIRTVSDTFMMDWNDEDYMRSITMPNAISIPTQQMAIRWLREKHKLHCSVVLKDVTEDTYVYSIADLGDDRHWIRGEYLEYPSYEEACESAIKYCLENLI